MVMAVYGGEHVGPYVAIPQVICLFIVNTVVCFTKNNLKQWKFIHIPWDILKNEILIISKPKITWI